MNLVEFLVRKGEPAGACAFTGLWSEWNSWWGGWARGWHAALKVDGRSEDLEGIPTSQQTQTSAGDAYRRVLIWSCLFIWLRNTICTCRRDSWCMSGAVQEPGLCGWRWWLEKRRFSCYRAACYVRIWECWIMHNAWVIITHAHMITTGSYSLQEFPTARIIFQHVIIGLVGFGGGCKLKIRRPRRHRPRYFFSAKQSRPK